MSKPGETSASWGAVIRPTIGLLGFVVALFALVLVPFMIVGPFIGGGDLDRSMRGVIALGLVAAVGLFAAMVGLLNMSVRKVIRSPGARLLAIALLMLILFAAYGIDSTARVRALPEASLSYANATEVRAWAAPAQGGIDAPIHATFTREFVTADRYSAVGAFYASKLEEAGWTGPSTWGGPNEQFMDWRRDGFMLQLRFPTASDESGPYTVRIYGPG
jgi:hypothetical protein